MNRAEAKIDALMATSAAQFAALMAAMADIGARLDRVEAGLDKAEESSRASEALRAAGIRPMYQNGASRQG